MPSMHRTFKPLRLLAVGAFSCVLLSGCITYTVVSAAASVAGVAVDAAVGTVKIVGKGVGKAADAWLDDDDNIETSTPPDSPAPEAAPVTAPTDHPSE